MPTSFVCTARVLRVEKVCDMIQNNRIYRSLLVLIAILHFVCLVVACEKKQDTSEKQIRRAEVPPTIDLARPDQEIVALLAIKYNKKIEMIKTVLETYGNEPDMRPIPYKKKEDPKEQIQNQPERYPRDEKSYTDKVAKISGQFSLDPAIVASILIDYKVLKAAKGMEGCL
jgi:hypothetical protein